MHGCTIHYEGTDGVIRADHSECAAQVEGIRAYHLAHGYNDIAYCWLACQHGGDFRGRGWGPNAASGDTWANLNTNAICAIIGPSDVPSVELLTTLARLIDVAPDGREAVYPHSHWFNTSCCGDPLRAWVEAGALAPAPPAPIPEGFYDMDALLADVGGGRSRLVLKSGPQVLVDVTGEADPEYGLPLAQLQYLHVNLEHVKVQPVPPPACDDAVTIHKRALGV